MKRGLTPILILCFAPSVSVAADWYGCASDLDSLRRAARDASYEAEQAETAAEELEDARTELENCIAFPDVYDLLEDGCNSQRWDHESARDEYQSAVDSLSTELWTVGRRIRSVQWSCEYDFSLAGSTYQKDTARDEWCAAILTLKGKFQAAALLQACKRSRSEAECRKCLALP